MNEMETSAASSPTSLPTSSPTSSPMSSPTSSPTSSPAVLALVAAARRASRLGLLRVLALMVWRPLAAWLASKLLLGGKGARRAVATLPVYVAFCAPRLAFRLARLLLRTLCGVRLVLAPVGRRVDAGVYCQKGGRASVLAAAAGLNELQARYWSPMLNGDWSSVLPTVSHMVRRQANAMPSTSTTTPGRRVLMPSSVGADGDKFATDWMFPVRKRKGGGVCVLFAGIGGDSSSGYVQDVSQAFLDDGWTTCCINARGMKSSPRVHRLENIFNPYDSADLETVLDYILGDGGGGGDKEALRAGELDLDSNKVDPDTTAGGPDDGHHHHHLHKNDSVDIILVGFSLGAISLGKYMTSKGPLVPRNVRAAIMFSGAFSMEFAEWWRYREVFQPMIVPELVCDFGETYGANLERKFSKEQLLKAGSASSYRALVSDLLLPAMKKSDPGQDEDALPASYEAFQDLGKSSSADRGRIARPTLLVTAIDDPLHNPEMLGFSTNDPVESPDLLYMITEEGGHVGWPTDVGGGSAFMRKTALSFAKAAACE